MPARLAVTKRPENEDDVTEYVPAEPAAIPAWEYVTTPLMIHSETRILNSWGKKGWELVQITTGPEGGLIAFLKRPAGIAAV